ncbi:hypothetical protein PR048_020539 [Dryococelus australis]|uniref:TGF-beta propeptide domain-containing protein n=1 Tax=Dryococelus australis TaxID=614101 RepID=A0ABQ9H6J2_9NEOP|nr:hypothetical protein PR048_020539 [Dryococelus australis]
MTHPIVEIPIVLTSNPIHVIFARRVGRKAVQCRERELGCAQPARSVYLICSPWLRVLLQVFGLPERNGRAQRQHEVPPQFMTELYSAVAGPNGLVKGSNPYNAKVVRSFIERGERARSPALGVSHTDCSSSARVPNIHLRPNQHDRQSHVVNTGERVCLYLKVEVKKLPLEHCIWLYNVKNSCKIMLGHGDWFYAASEIALPHIYSKSHTAQLNQGLVYSDWGKNGISLRKNRCWCVFHPADSSKEQFFFFNVSGLEPDEYMLEAELHIFRTRTPHGEEHRFFPSSPDCLVSHSSLLVTTLRGPFTVRRALLEPWHRDVLNILMVTEPTQIWKPPFPHLHDGDAEGNGEHAPLHWELHLHVYQVVDEHALSQPDLQRLLSVQYISASGTGWLVANVKQAVLDWLDGRSPNLGLLVVASSLFGEPVRLHVARRDHHHNSKQPILVLFDGDRRHPVRDDADLQLGHDASASGMRPSNCIFTLLEPWTKGEADRSRWLRTANLHVPTLNCFSAYTSSKNGVDWV